jgi:hypothetical protein
MQPHQGPRHAPRGAALRRARRARSITRALALGAVHERPPAVRSQWELFTPRGAPTGVRVWRTGERPLGTTRLVRQYHSRDCRHPTERNSYIQPEHRSLSEALAHAPAIVCLCPCEPWSDFPQTRPGAFWVVVEHTRPRARALQRARAAAENCQRKRRRFRLYARAFEDLYQRRVKLPRARALGIDWSEMDWSDDELAPETRGRTLPRDAQRYGNARALWVRARAS